MAPVTVRTLTVFGVLAVAIYLSPTADAVATVASALTATESFQEHLRLAAVAEILKMHLHPEVVAEIFKMHLHPEVVAEIFKQQLHPAEGLPTPASGMITL